MKVCVFAASSRSIDEAYFEEARALGAELARRGHAVVFGGGTSGLMGAAARGATAEGGELIGVAPRFFDQPGILYEGCTQMLFTETMSERKKLMEDMSDAFVTLPGGIGTFEEFFEILTLRQLGRHNKPIGVLNTRDYFAPLHAMFEASIQEGFVKPACRALYAMLDDPEALLDYIESDEAANVNVRGMKNI